MIWAFPLRGRAFPPFLLGGLLPPCRNTLPPASPLPSVGLLRCAAFRRDVARRRLYTDGRFNSAPPPALKPYPFFFIKRDCAPHRRSRAFFRFQIFLCCFRPFSRRYLSRRLTHREKPDLPSRIMYRPAFSPAPPRLSASMLLLPTSRPLISKIPHSSDPCAEIEPL
jgi:hypothetical protein